MTDLSEETIPAQNPSTSTPAETPDPAHMPLLLAARTLKHYGVAAEHMPVLPAIAEALRLSLHALEDRDTEEILAQQSQVLNTVFNVMLMQGVHRTYFERDHIELALKAQKQCRTTMESMQRVKNKKIDKRTEGMNN